MARLSVVGRPKPDGSVLVYLYAHARPAAGGPLAKRYVSLGMKVRGRDWNPERAEVRKTHPQHTTLNRQLADAKSRAGAALAVIEADAQRDARPVGIEEMITAARRIARPNAPETAPEKAEGLFAFTERRIAEMEGEARIGTAKKYRTVLTKLRAAAKSDEVPFRAVTVEYVRAFEHALRKLGNAPNTVEKNLATLRAIVREASKRGHMDQAAYPFFHVTLKRVKVRKAALGTADIDRLAAVELSQPWDRLARDMWLFAFYAGGMRFGDVARLRWDAVRGDRLEYEMGKTGEGGGIVLIPQARAILDGYRDRQGSTAGGGEGHATVFPALDGYDLSDPETAFKAVNGRNVYANTAIQRVARKAGVETHVTFHMARHSLARYLVDKGLSVYEVQHVLRHSSVKVTESYLASLTDEALDGSYAAAFASAPPSGNLRT